MTLTFTITINVPSGVNVNNSEIVAFVQHMPSKSHKTAKHIMVWESINMLIIKLIYILLRLDL